MTLALSWEAAHPSAPPEIMAALESEPDFGDLDLLLAIPEYQVDLPGGQRPSQTDVLALMRGPSGLVAVAVEGKVDEAFGPTVGQKRAEASVGVDRRLAWLIDYLGLAEVVETVRYQLLHRTASALLVAEQFDASAAVMLVHSSRAIRGFAGAVLSKADARRISSHSGYRGDCEDSTSYPSSQIEVVRFGRWQTRNVLIRSLLSVWTTYTRESPRAGSRSCWVCIGESRPRPRTRSRSSSLTARD